MLALEFVSDIRCSSCLSVCDLFVYLYKLLIFPKWQINFIIIFCDLRKLATQKSESNAQFKESVICALFMLTLQEGDTVVGREDASKLPDIGSSSQLFVLKLPSSSCLFSRSCQMQPYIRQFTHKHNSKRPMAF